MTDRSHTNKDQNTSPEKSSEDTMDLASSRRCRRDFLVSALPAAFLLRSTSTLAWRSILIQEVKAKMLAIIYGGAVFIAMVITIYVWAL